MRLPLSAIVAPSVVIGSQFRPSFAFLGSWGVKQSTCASFFVVRTDHNLEHDASKDLGDTRRSVLKKASVVAGSLTKTFTASEVSHAAVGTLPEFDDTNAILQGITVSVADQSQQESMIKFLTDAFDFDILRQRKIGSTTDTVSLPIFLP